MMIHSWRGGAAGMLLAVMVLSGCATAYGPRGLTGGYTETRIEEGLYRVSFFGNGKTSRDKVWNYWIYRCAELTLQQGYTHFILLKPDEPVPKPVALAPTGIGDIVAGVLGENGGDPLARATPTQAVPIFIYTPSYPIINYANHATVKMVRNPAAYPGRAMVRADVIVRLVGPYVQSGGSAPVLPDREVLKLAAVIPPGAAPGTATTPAAQRNSRVTLDDLKYLLPPP